MISTALDHSEVIGRVMRFPDGSTENKWMWAMTAIRIGPPFPHPRSGEEAIRAEAGRRVLEAYKRLLFLAGPGR